MRLLFLATVTLIGCRSPESVSRHEQTTVADSAGVRIVHNRGADIDIPLIELFRLGTVDGEGPELFSDIKRVSFDDGGRILVANGMSRSVRAFGADGIFLREYGGQGEGPGELRTLDEMTVSGDSLVLIDWQRRGNAVLFNRRGEFLWAGQILLDDGSYMVPVLRSPKGWIWSSGEEPPSTLSPGDSAVLESRFLVGGFHPPRDTVHSYSHPMLTIYGVIGAEGGVDWGLFRSRRYAGFASDGRYFLSHASEYQIDVYDWNGRVTSIRRALPPIQVTQEDVEAVKSAMVSIIDTLSSVPDAYRPGQRVRIGERFDQQVQLPIPEAISPVTNVLVSPEGSIWVQRRDDTPIAIAEAEELFERRAFPDRPRTWDIFGIAGRYVGSVEVPARCRVDAVRNSHALAVCVDEMDVEYVVRFAAQYSATSNDGTAGGAT